MKVTEHLLYVPKMKCSTYAVTNFTIRVNARPHFSIVLTLFGVCSPELLLLYRYEMLALMLTNMELFRTFSERLGPPPHDADETNDALDLSHVSSADRLSFRSTE